MSLGFVFKTLFDFALVVLAVICVVYEKRLIIVEKKLGRWIREYLGKEKSHDPNDV